MKLPQVNLRNLMGENLSTGGLLFHHSLRGVGPTGRRPIGAKYLACRLTFAKNRIIFHHLFHIIFCFFERRNPLILLNNSGTCIIGSKC